MSLLQPKQIFKIQSGIIKIQNFAVTSGATSSVITSQLSSALAVAGQGNVAVPLIVSANATVAGVPVASPTNRCDIWDSTTKLKIATVTGTYEVYGRITNSGSTWTLTYYYLDASGAEQSYSFPGNENIDFDFVYRFTFAQFPSDGLVSITTRNVYQDPRGAGAVAIIESLTVASTNVLSNSSQSASYPLKGILYVNGKAELAADATPPFTVSGAVITWNSVNAGYILETTDDVVYEYYV